MLLIGRIILDWLATVDEILDFKEVHKDMRVSLVATNLEEEPLRGGSNLSKVECIKERPRSIVVRNY